MNIQDVSIQVYYIQVAQYAMFKTTWVQTYFVPEDGIFVPKHVGDTFLILYLQLILCMWLVQ